MSGISINLNFLSKLLEECACDLTLGYKLRHWSSNKVVQSSKITIFSYVILQKFTIVFLDYNTR